MESNIPKQFLILSGIPVIFHSIYRFFQFDPRIQLVVALPEQYFSLWQGLCKKLEFNHDHLLTKGGQTRYDTVKNALLFIPDNHLVAIHDAVRPLVSKTTIERGFLDALTFGNAIPSVPVSESVRWIDKSKNRPVNREHLRNIQTPQIFKASLIKTAYLQINNNSFTDDAGVLEAMGETIHLFEGNGENIKITYPTDLQFAESMMKNF